MPFGRRGKDYHYVIGSDVDRDGMYLQVTEARTALEILEVFYSDQTDLMTFSAYRSDIPLDVVEWAIAAAKERLIPIAKR